MAIENINQYTYYQWDIGRVLEVAEEYLSYIFLFQNEGAGKSYVARAVSKTRNGEAYGEVPIPNIIFQQAGNVYVYYCDGIITENEETDEYGNKLITVGNLKTIARQTLFIYRRGKPDNYVYTPEDLIAYDGLSYEVNELKNRSQAMEANIEAQGANIESLQAIDISLDKRISNIEHRINQDYFFIDDNIAYEKRAPNRACPYAQVNSIGSMTYKSEQLLTFPYVDTTITRNGITFTVNEDGSVTANGTATGHGFFVLFKKILPVGAYFLSGTPINSANAIMYAGNSDYSLYKTDTGSGVAFNVATEELITVVISMQKGATVSNLVFKPMLNKGTKAEPYGIYQGLIQAKTTAIRSHGANLIPFPYKGEKGVGHTETNNGINFKINNDHSITIKGTASADTDFILQQSAQYGASNINAVLENSATNGSYTISKRLFYNAGNKMLSMNITKGTTVDEIVYPMVNIGTELAPYSLTREPINYIVPEAIQALDGYGWGINGACYNYITKKENKWVFIQKVDEVDLGSLTWTVVGSAQEGYKRYIADFSQVKTPASDNTIANILCGKYESKSSTDVYLANDGIAISISGKVCIFDSLLSSDTLSNFTNAIQGVKMYYELAEPIETDITHLFTDDYFIEVEGGGSLEFISEISKPVPSSITYLLKEGSI